ncbi:MAG: 4Fe-4S binding protein, partial [Smithellaceae bacterium]|nr:4Fe-4S binding protein [Smithellaceae bacterium]
VGRVVVAGGSNYPPAIRDALNAQIRMARALLRGLGISENAIQSDDDRVTEDSGKNSASPTVRPLERLLPNEISSAAENKCAFTRAVAQYLYDRSDTREPALSLPAGSPFGTVTVDAERCTLCMACAVSCPTEALTAGGDVPRLSFVESRCHQCGLCTATCPEDAIRLIPRLLCDRQAVEKGAIVREVEAARCIECGAPFASEAMIRRIREKLIGHWMYEGERQLRRLQMCSTCRARDALSSAEISSWIAR